MRYKTRRAILKVFYNIFYITLIALGYIYAAHRNILPAFFEYYTGNLVRESTASWSREYLMSGGEEAPAFDFMNVVDYALGESTYKYVTDILQSLDKGFDQFPMRARDEAMAVGNHPGLMEWLKKPKGNFASIFKYEAIRYLESSESFRIFAILDQSGKSLYNNGLKESDFSTLKAGSEVEYDDGLVSIPVVSAGKITGRVIASVESNIASVLSFENSGMDISWVLLGKEDKPVSSSVHGEARKFFTAGQYTGATIGISEGFRFQSRNIGKNRLIVIYPAASSLFYLIKLLLYVVLAGILILAMVLWRKHNPLERVTEKVKNLGPERAYQLLEKSNALNQEYAAISIKFQNGIQSMKLQEIDRLRLISEHLTYLHKAATPAKEESYLEIKSLE